MTLMTNLNNPTVLYFDVLTGKPTNKFFGGYVVKFNPIEGTVYESGNCYYIVNMGKLSCTRYWLQGKTIQIHITEGEFVKGGLVACGYFFCNGVMSLAERVYFDRNTHRPCNGFGCCFTDTGNPCGIVISNHAMQREWLCTNSPIKLMDDKGWILDNGQRVRYDGINFIIEGETEMDIFDQDEREEQFDPKAPPRLKLHDAPNQALIARIGTKVVQTLLDKNYDYGSSVFDPPPLCPTMRADAAILVRMSDKLARLSTLLKGQEATVAESIEDTMKDLGAYAILWLCAKELNNG